MKDSRYIGVDIGGTFIKLGIVSGAGEVSMRREVPIDRSGSETVMETVMRGIDGLLSDAGLAACGFEGIGVSAAGCVDNVNGRIAENGGNVPGWARTEVAKPLSERYGLPVTLANDGNCVALGEAWTGAARGLKDVVCIVLGTGVGGGIISGGRIVEGRHGFGGEVGHFPTHAECSAKNAEDRNSHYERFAATSALVRRASEINETWQSGRDVFEAAAAGDTEALDLLDSWTDEIAYGLAGFVHVFDPEIIIIGGGVSKQEELLIKPLREKVLSMVISDFRDGLEIRAASLGNDAGMAGAVKYLIDRSAERDSD